MTPAYAGSNPACAVRAWLWAPYKLPMGFKVLQQLLELPFCEAWAAPDTQEGGKSMSLQAWNQMSIEELEQLHDEKSYSYVIETGKITQIGREERDREWLEANWLSVMTVGSVLFWAVMVILLIGFPEWLV